MTAPGQRSKRECNCPPSCVYCAETGTCNCPEDHAPVTDLTLAKKFERFCEENEGAIECRIYD